MFANVPRIGVACAVLVLVCDQISKALVLSTLPSTGQVRVLSMFNLVLVHNHGVSFGMLGGMVPWWVLAGLSIAVVAGLGVWLWRTPDRFTGAGLGLVIGGALGNAADRLHHGAVTDFLDVHWAGHHWPAFNFADVGLVCGAALLLKESSRQG